MLTYRKKIFIILLSLIGTLGFGQSSADLLVNELREKTNQIQSFEADAIVRVDVDFINIKDREVKIKFTAPDQFSFDTKGLLLLPKNGVQMEYMTLFNENFTAIEAGNELVREIPTQIIKVIPESLESEIILAQLWIDPKEKRIMKMKTFTRKSGSYVVDFEYLLEEDILPSKLIVVFEISNMSIPVKMMNDFMKDSSAEPDSLPKDARVIIEYSNYKISLNQPTLPLP